MWNAATPAGFMSSFSTNLVVFAEKNAKKVIATFPRGTSHNVQHAADSAAPFLPVGMV